VEKGCLSINQGKQLLIWGSFMNLFENKEFKLLKSKWYELLKKEGFDDKENDQGFLKQWDSLWLKHHKDKGREYLKGEYFRSAELFLERNSFKSKHEKEIWKFHSEGLSLREIASRMNMNLNQIFRAVKNLKKEMMFFR
jgi:DNA-directed RNA polymerase specialized sigma24 family protein